LLAELLPTRLTGADDESAETSKGERDQSMSGHHPKPGAATWWPGNGQGARGESLDLELQSPAVIALLEVVDRYLLTTRNDPLWLGQILDEDVPEIFAHHAEAEIRQRKQKLK
jgi:hypothetical protein